MTDSDSESDILGWRCFFEGITHFLNDLQRHYNTANENYALYAVERLEICITNVRDLRQHLINSAHGQISSEVGDIIQQYVTELSELLHCMETLYCRWSEYCDEVVRQDLTHAYRTPTECFGVKGRPRLCVTRNQLEYLKSLAFTWSEIAAIIGVSHMTLYRRRLEYSMLDEDPSEKLTDTELEQKLHQMRQQNPHFGETMAMGHLRSLGYNVTRERLRRAVCITDPINHALRWRGMLTARKPCSVPGPNALWHQGKFSEVCVLVAHATHYNTS